MTSSPASRWTSVVAATYANDQPIPVATMATATGSGSLERPTAATATAKPVVASRTGPPRRSRPTSEVAAADPTNAPKPPTAVR